MTDVSSIQRSIRDVDKFLNYVEHVPENLEAAAASLQEIAGRLLLIADRKASAAEEGKVNAAHDHP